MDASVAPDTTAHVDRGTSARRVPDHPPRPSNSSLVGSADRQALAGGFAFPRTLHSGVASARQPRSACTFAARSASPRWGTGGAFFSFPRMPPESDLHTV